MMKSYKKIMVAVDGSLQAEEAVREAVNLAKENKASLYIVHVKEDVSLYVTPRLLPVVTQDLEEQSTIILEKVHKIINDELAYETISINGSAKREIVDFAKKNEIDLIVIGSTGKGALDRVLIGSTTAYVVSHASCNVMVVK